MSRLRYGPLLHPEDDEPKGWDVAQICEEGHVVNACHGSDPIYSSPHCGRCGATTITQCPGCHASIRGVRLRDIYVSQYSPPRYCHNCGAPYPWTERKLQAMRELVEQAEGLEDDERQALQEDLEELVKHTPAAVPAAKRAGKLTEKILEPTKALLYQFAVDVASEAAVKAMRGY